MNKFFSRYTLIVFASTLLSAQPETVTAAPGDLTDTPLFLQSGVKPNIFFTVDDSGSMDWEVLLTNGALADHSSAPDSGNLDFSPNDFNEDREHCAGYNAMAYNPTSTYTPWAGVDANNNAYQDQSITAALTNPYNPASGTVNLLNADSTGYAAVYGVWVDADNDGVYDAGECPVGATSSGDYSNRAPLFTDSRWVFVNNLSAQQQTNYANWYSYYRKREYVAKKALSEIIVRATSRMGLGTLHNNNNVNTQITDVDDITTPVNSVAQANKNTLMNKLFRINSSGGTPLRRSLRDVGEYYKGNGGLFSGGASPILPAAQGGECQQNFAVLMSDGFWNGSSPSVGNTDGDGNTVFDGGAYADSYSNTLADVAMKYYENDLSAGLTDKVPETQLDNNGNANEGDMHQHMVTYTVAFGINGSLDPSTDDPEAAGFAWPQPVADDPTTIDDMWHAAFNGRGLFLSAKDPDTLISSLNEAIQDIADRQGTAAAVSFNSTSIQAGSLIFRASFNSLGWHGDLKAFAITKDPVNGSAKVAATPKWSAADKLDIRNYATRQIITFNGQQGIPFEWPSGFSSLPFAGSSNELNSKQVNDLLTNSSGKAAGATDNDYGQAIVEYLRGNNTTHINPNGHGFRDRNGHRLGDIVQSSPIFVGPPSTPYPDNLEGSANLYSSFKNSQSARPDRVYVGANDGMLHAFDKNGDEVFAYIPGMLFSNTSGEGLHKLAEPAYDHRYYVDLSPTVADVFIGGGWKTYLLGGLRGGGKGVFALDITNAGALNEANAGNIVKWEFTHPDLGYTYSDVRIIRTNAKNLSGKNRWAAVFGNGYNSDPSGDGTAKLFIVYLDDGSYEVLETGAGSVVSIAGLGDCSDPASDCNGLSSPEIADLNGDVTIDRVYAGDLQGNMWVFDISESDTSKWGVAYKDSGNNPEPLFTACTSSTCVSSGKAVNRQPITTRPSIERHPTRSRLATAPNILVFFGTGQYLTSADNSSTGLQSFYGVWDGGSYGLASSPVPLGRDDLQSQIVGKDANGNRTITDHLVNYSPGAVAAEYGWKIDLPVSKERVVVGAQAFGDVVFFNTLIPTAAICDSGGVGFLMNVALENGGEPDFAVVDLNNDGDLSNDAFTAGILKLGIPTESKFIKNEDKYTRVTVDSKGNIHTENVTSGPPDSSGRKSWSHIEY